MKIVIILGSDRMKKYRFKGYLTDYKRLYNSTCGNPCYWLQFTNDTESICGRTATNASCAYGALNQIDNERIVEYHYTRTGNLIIDYIHIKGVDY